MASRTASLAGSLATLALAATEGDDAHPLFRQLEPDDPELLAALDAELES